MEIKFEDYLSEQERKDIVASVFMAKCQERFEKDAERIFSNAAYSIVHKIIDDMHDGKVDQLIAEKAKTVIEGLSVYAVFRKADHWEKGESEGYKSLNQAILNNRDALNAKIAALIDGLGEYELRETIKEQAQELLDQKLFGKAA